MCTPLLGVAATAIATKKHVIDPMKEAKKMEKQNIARMEQLEEEQRQQELQRRRDNLTENRGNIDTSTQRRTSQVNRALRTSMLGRRGFLIPTIGTGGASTNIGGI